MPTIATQGTMTDHGGAVLAATGGFTAGGQRAAVVGDAVTCPLPGHGPTTILAGSSSVRSAGKGVARLGDACACGAVLIGTPTKFQAGG